MKNKRFFILLTVAVLLCVFSLSVCADTGPKPSVNVEITGIEGEYYVTLLSLYESTGPASAWNGTEELKNNHGLDPVIWEKFTYYEDSDGFYFLQQASKCEGHDTYIWGYYPPSTFKVLVYIPASDTFISSGVCERYAFDSYFSFDVTSDGANLSAKTEKNYDYTAEILSLLARVVLTVVLEIGLALLFGYRARGELLLISCVNVVTQIALNVALNAVNFHSGQYAFVAWYINLEFAVMAAEALVYFALLPRVAKTEKSRTLGVVYSAAANTFSFVLGMLLAQVIPGIF